RRRRNDRLFRIGDVALEPLRQCARLLDQTARLKKRTCLLALRVAERWVADHESQRIEQDCLEPIGGKAGRDLRARRERDVALGGCAASEDADPDALEARCGGGHDATRAAGSSAGPAAARGSRSLETY